MKVQRFAEVNYERTREQQLRAAPVVAEQAAKVVEVATQVKEQMEVPAAANLAKSKGQLKKARQVRAKERKLTETETKAVEGKGTDVISSPKVNKNRKKKEIKNAIARTSAVVITSKANHWAKVTPAPLKPVRISLFPNVVSPSMFTRFTFSMPSSFIYDLKLCLSQPRAAIPAVPFVEEDEVAVLTIPYETLCIEHEDDKVVIVESEVTEVREGNEKVIKPSPTDVPKTEKTKKTFYSRLKKMASLFAKAVKAPFKMAANGVNSLRNRVKKL